MANALLFVDMLGVRSRWRAQGRAGAEFAFKHWIRLVNSALQASRLDTIDVGLVETDALALVFNDVGPAIDTGTLLFRAAFTSRVQESGDRFWLRGVIVSVNNEVPIRSLAQLPTVPRVEVGTYSPDLLEAIAVEKSGFKGMRLLIESSCLTEQVRRASATQIGTRSVPRCLQLTLSDYPARVAGKYSDVLWMATPGEDEWAALKALMARRLARSAKSADEFLHAAATEVVFHECGAAFGKVRKKQGLDTPDYGTKLKAVLGFGKKRPNQRLHPTAAEKATGRG